MSQKLDNITIPSGAIPEKPSKKDYRFEYVAGAGILPEEFSLRDKVEWIKDQGRSLSCTGQATSYYLEILNKLETNQYTKLSARDIYSSVHLPNGGAYIRDAVIYPVKNGVMTEEDAPSYINGNPPTEAYMRQRNDITEEDIERGYTYLAKSAFRIYSKSIEDIKRAIYNYNGCIIGVVGDNAGWGKPYKGIVKLPKRREWGHAIYLIGWKKINGVDYFEFVNSFGDGWGDNGFGYLSFEYVKRGFIFNPWVIIDMPNEYYPVLKKKATILQRLIVLYRLLIDMIKQSKVVKIFNK